MLDDRWQTIWDDLTAEVGEPLVENTILQALEDKVSAAASIEPQIYVNPTRGTRKDRAEGVATQRRRVFLSYLQASRYSPLRKKLFIDRIAHAAAFSIPQMNYFYQDGRPIPVEGRHPYIVRIDPRSVYPLTHTTSGRLASAIVTRTRRYAEVKAEWGADHPGIRQLEIDRRLTGTKDTPLSTVEESWYFDDSVWAVALSARPLQSPTYMNFQYVTRYDIAVEGRLDVWMQPPIPHGIELCPVVESKRVAWDDGYRGELDAMIPRLKVAQGIMARYLEDLTDAIASPVVMTGIRNPDDYGPYAELIDDGSGSAKLEYPRKPQNFEARQAVLDQVEMSRRQGRFPAQRSGDAGTGWTTDRGVTRLLGSYDGAIADAQSDVAMLLSDVLSICAHYDEVHCAARKTIEGHDGSVPFIETYNPASLFKGDYRVQVTYGAATGLDRTQLLSQLAIMSQMGRISNRRFMRLSGMVDDELQEERTIMEEQIAQAMTGFVFQQAAAGNIDPLRRLKELLDPDDRSVHQAILDVLTETQSTPAPGPGNTPGPPGSELDALLASATGGPPPLASAGQSLRSVLPNGISQFV